MAYEDLDDYSVGAAGSDTFDIVIPDLDPNTEYPIQFRWQFADKTVGEWSVSKLLNTPEIARPESTNIVAVWNGINLEISWDAPNLANGFVIYLTSGSTTVPFGYTLDKTKTAQKAIITAQNLRDSFAGVFVTTLTGLLKTTYIDTSSSGSAFSIPPYADSLDGAAVLDSSWAITPVDLGFSVSWNAIPTTGTYWETVVYKSSTENGTYVAVGSATNAPVIIKELNTVYIKIRHRLITGQYSAYSNPKQAAAYVPIVFDTTPPNEVVVNSAVWSGNNIVITYTMPATDPASRFKITLTNGSDSGDFYEYPGGQTGTHTITLYDNEIYQQIGERYSSYTGNFISIDAAENPTTGTPFLVGTKTNPLADLIPLYTLTSLANGYVAKFSNTITDVAYIEIYAKSTSFGTLDPVTGVIDAQYLVYSGSNPGTVISTDYTNKYIRTRYFTISGQFSKWSAEQQIAASDPGSLSLIDNPVKISTNGSIFTGNLDISGQPIQSGARVFFNRTGLYVYDSLTTSPTTQIIGNAAPAVEGDLNTVAPTFITTRAKIADWIIYPDRFENALTATTGTYTGIAPSGTYAIWAGGNSSKNTDGLAKFSVTHAGAVTARNISIIGNGSSSTKIIDAGSFFVRNDGYLEASGAKITGEINANSGTFKGQVDIGTGSDPSGVLRVSSGDGTILIGRNALIGGTTVTAGITASITSGTPAVTTTNFYIRASDGYLFSQYGQIGGWTIGASKLSGGGGASAVGLQIDSTAGGYAFWAGAGSPDTNTPFSVTNTGVLRATNAIITGEVKATSGRIGNATTGWEITGTQIKSSGFPTGTSALIMDASTGTISGGLITGTKVVASSFEFTAGTDFIKSDKTFSLGGGVLTYAGSGDVTLNGSSLTFTGATNAIFGDDNGYGGDSTVVLNQNAQLTKGRAFHYGGTTIPTSSNTARQVYNTKKSAAQGTNVFDLVSFTAGDLWMTVD
jgi:hypothetical protein